MTFRVDDLLVAILPERKATEGGCPEPSVDNTPVNSDACIYGRTDGCDGGNTCLTPEVTDPNGDHCVDPPKKGEQMRTERSWRDEQFAMLSAQLEDVLAR